jgi:micrococcal nuclease
VKAVLAAAVVLVVVLSAASWLGQDDDSAPITMDDDFFVERGTYRVMDVIDGDTIRVDAHGVTERVRLVGIDAPETWGDDECYGPEATAELRDWIEGDRVLLLVDPSQGERDRWDRVLAYVVEGHVNVNLAAIQAGIAREYTYDEPYTYQQAFRTAEADARDAGAGLWGACDA